MNSIEAVRLGVFEDNEDALDFFDANFPGNIRFTEKTVIGAARIIEGLQPGDVDVILLDKHLDRDTTSLISSIRRRDGQVIIIGTSADGPVADVDGHLHKGEVNASSVWSIIQNRKRLD